MKTKYPSRRDVLMTAATLAAGSSISGIAGTRAHAATAEPALSNALGDVDQALRQAVNAQTVPGVVAIGANDRGIVYEGAFGPNVTADSVFWIASMTKAITATAAMQLVEQGKLELDEPVGKLLPDLASPKVLEGFDANGAPKLRPAKRPITLRHLLTHTAGFTYAIWSEPLTRYQKATGLPDSAPASTRRCWHPWNSTPVIVGNTASTSTGPARRSRRSATNRWRCISARTSSGRSA